jgi:hypothetical protein
MTGHRLVPRLSVIAAGVLSAPFVVFPLVAGAYIAYSLVADDWYRDMFGGYGTKLLVLYACYAFGIVGAAVMSAPRFGAFAPGVRLVVVALTIVGVVAAMLLEREFWDDTDRPFPRGLLFVPFVLWALVAGLARLRRARKDAP